MRGKEKMSLSDTGIARLRPREREYTIWDSRLAGLGVRVRPSGAASYVLLLKSEGRSRRLSLGPIASRNVDSVRRECHALMARHEPDKTSGVALKAPLFRDFVAGAWKETHFSQYKPSTRKGTDGALRRRLLPAFGSTPLGRITRNQVLRWFDDYSETAPGGANRTLDLLGQILNFAIACGHIETNPVRDVKRNRSAVLTRFLSGDEIRRLHHSLDEYSCKGPGARQQADIIRLLLLTGCRKSEILKMRWCEVDGDTLVLADSKTGPRKVPLNTRARGIIERQPRGDGAFVFPSPRDAVHPRTDLKLWYAIRRNAGIEDVRLHDLRHSFASHAVMNGVPVPVVSRLLGHSKVRMTLRYAHLADRDIEAAAERVGAAMARAMALDCPPPARRSRAGIDRATIGR